MRPAGLQYRMQSHIHGIAVVGATSTAVKTKVAQHRPARRSAGRWL